MYAHRFRCLQPEALTRLGEMLRVERGGVPADEVQQRKDHTAAVLEHRENKVLLSRQVGQRLQRKDEAAHEGEDRLRDLLAGVVLEKGGQTIGKR